MITGRPDSPNFFRYPLSIPGEVSLPQRGCIVSARVCRGPCAGVRCPQRSREQSCDGIGGHRQLDTAAELCEIGDRATGSSRSGSTGRRNCRIFWWTGRWRVRERDHVPLVVDENDRIVWVAGHEIDEAFRVTEASQAVLILRLRRVSDCGGVWRLCVNSTLKSLLFWMVLVVVGVLIWNFSTKFQRPRTVDHLQ